MTARTSKPVCLFAQMSLRCLAFQHQDPGSAAVTAGYSAHGLGVRVWVSLALVLVDTVHLAAALATAFALGLSFTRCLAIVFSLRWPLTIPAVPRDSVPACRTRSRSCRSCRQPVSSAPCPSPSSPRPCRLLWLCGAVVSAHPPPLALKWSPRD